MKKLKAFLMLWAIASAVFIGGVAALWGLMLGLVWLADEMPAWVIFGAACVLVAAVFAAIMVSAKDDGCY